MRYAARERTSEKTYAREKIAAGKLEACVALHHLGHRGAPRGAAGFKVGAIYTGDEARVYRPSHRFAGIRAHLGRAIFRIHGRAIARRVAPVNHARIARNQAKRRTVRKLPRG